MDINAEILSAINDNVKTSFQKGISEAELLSNPLIEKVSSSGASNIYTWFQHVPGFKEWKEGQDRVLRNVETKSYTVENRKFEDTIQIDEDTVKDDQYGQYGGIAKAVGATGALLQDQLVFEVLDNGFSGGGVTTYDDEALFSDSHTIGMSTIDNLSTDALSETAVESAIMTMRGYKVKVDKESTARPLAPGEKFVMVVPPALEMTARKIVMRERNDAGADNHLYKAAELVVSSWLSSNTEWFLLNIGAGVKPIFVQEREKLAIKSLNSDNSDLAFIGDKLIWGAKARLAALPTFPWLAYGSTGASGS